MNAEEDKEAGAYLADDVTIYCDGGFFNALE